MFLSSRKWTLLVAEEEAADFICSDHPVVGLASVDPEVLVPLGRRTCLYSRRDPLSAEISVDQDLVAEINGRQLNAASRFVYSQSATFLSRHS